MEGGPIDVDRETSFSDGEIGHRDRAFRIRRADGHLLLGIEAVLLEESQELELEWRSDASLVGFEPRARVFHVTGLEWA